MDYRIEKDTMGEVRVPIDAYYGAQTARAVENFPISGLSADPIFVKTSNDEILIQPQRTNNILERLFREIKRSYRKKSGSKALGKILKAMLSDTPLVKNLQNPEYLKIILDGKANLQERFSEIDAQLVQKELLNQQDFSEKVPPKIKKMIKLPELPEALVALFAG